MRTQTRAATSGDILLTDDPVHRSVLYGLNRYVGSPKHSADAAQQLKQLVKTQVWKTVILVAVTAAAFITMVVTDQVLGFIVCLVAVLFTACMGLIWWGVRPELITEHLEAGHIVPMQHHKVNLPEDVTRDRTWTAMRFLHEADQERTRNAETGSYAPVQSAIEYFRGTRTVNPSARETELRRQAVEALTS